MIYLPSHGIRSLIPIERRVRRANLGLDRAVSKSQVFHLWFHPTNLAAHPEPMLEGLRRVFMKVARLRDSGKLEVRSMNSYGGDHSSRQVS